MKYVNKVIEDWMFFYFRNEVNEKKSLLKKRFVFLNCFLKYVILKIVN